MRPKRPALVKYKKKALKLIREQCNAAGIGTVKIFGVVKTLGSIDRKERLARKAYPHIKDFLGQDYIGVSVITKTRQDCYNALEVLKHLAVFPELSYRTNPLDHMTRPASAEGNVRSLSTPDPANSEAIQAIMEIRGIPARMHLRICTLGTFRSKKENRGKRIKKILEQIKEAEK